MTNPISSICEWLAAAPTNLTMAEAMCLEETGEVMQEFVVTDGVETDPHMPMIAEAMVGWAAALRQHGDLRVRVVDADALVDGHLDAAWCHLQAAAVLVGTENLAEAWSRLHKANVVDKKVDGAFVLNSTGKVTKPSGWQAPTYSDLIHNHQEITQ